VTAERCPSCGGEWVDGRIAVPIVGSLRFVYRLGTNEVTTEVAAQMCMDCGTVHLRARDPEAIVRARQAAAHGRAKPWSFRPHKGQEG
jgi:Zn-finger nucleic acid-binding protein